MSRSKITNPDQSSEQLQAIQALAQETGQPVEIVGRTFASVHNTLKSNARIHDYLVVLTSKKVRDELRK